MNKRKKSRYFFDSLFFSISKDIVSNFIDRYFKFTRNLNKRRRAYRRSKFFDQNSLFFFFFISYLSSIRLSPRRKGYRVPYPNPLEFLHCNEVSRHIGTILWSSRHIQRRSRLPLRLDFPFFPLSLFFLRYSHAIPLSPFFFHRQWRTWCEPRSVSHANSPVKGFLENCVCRDGTPSSGDRLYLTPHKNVRIVAGYRRPVRRFWNSVGVAWIVQRKDGYARPSFRFQRIGESSEAVRRKSVARGHREIRGIIFTLGPFFFTLWFDSEPVTE